ncbi:peptidase inhibitor family I36 protein [Lentzea sp. NPDC004782]|uniref:peptidase inhibitor family I36 protein n=1 Tax=Lentzea sp. NPDC004782 TaxID=3154458 RepID=UPI0033BD91EE
MRFVRRVFLALVPVALLMVVGVAAPSAQAAPVAPAAAAVGAVGAAYDTETGQALAAWDCNTGNVCFWNGFGGTGGRCMWDVADPDWTSGTVKCSWATTKEVKSVYNRGTSSSLTGVVFYRNTGYNDRIGCTRQGQKGDLAGTYQVRSHQWTNGRCG